VGGGVNRHKGAPTPLLPFITIFLFSRVCLLLLLGLIEVTRGLCHAEKTFVYLHFFEVGGFEMVDVFVIVLTEVGLFIDAPSLIILFQI